jgi:GNAT superfamily N-acetyltransferase
MSITLGETADATAIVAYLITLAAESRFTRSVAIDEPHLTAMVDLFLSTPRMTILLARDGEAICGVLALALSPGLLTPQITAAQACWYLSPEVRGGTLAKELLMHGEAWAASHGATALQMLAPEPRFASFYRRRGYVPKEQIFERRLTCRG